MRRKAGFNLIEIAIVLAVIGLVIGGIYIAAAAVAEQRRYERFTEEFWTILQNTKNVFAKQPMVNITAPLTYDFIKTLGLVPGTAFDDGTSFSGPYGNTYAIYSGLFITGFPSGLNRSVVILTALPQGACIKFLSANFGSDDILKGKNLTYLFTNSGQLWDGSAFTPDKAATMFCTSPLVAIFLGFSAD